MGLKTGVSLQVARQFIWYKLISNFKSESSRNYLGLIWWLLEPAMMLGIFYLVFGVLLNNRDANFASYLLIGVSGWIVVANTIMHSANSIQSSSGLIQQVYLPKWMLPVIVILSDCTKFLFVLLMLFAFLIYDGFSPDKAWFSLLYWVPLYLLLVAGCALIAAALTPLFPDLKFLIQAILQMLMFGSGIFYKYSVIPAQYMDWFMLNPIAKGLFHMREILLYARTPTINDILYIGFIAVILVFVGLTLLAIFNRRYPRLVV